MKDPRKAAIPDPPEVLRARIEEFVRSCRSPAVFEAGEQTIPLEPGRFDLQVQGGALVLHAWNEQSSVVRRILRIHESERGRIELATRRLAHGEGTLSILDLARAGPHLERQAGRLGFRERFRRILSRQFGGWEVAQISSSADLEHSLSPAYSRALLTRGQSAFAAIGVEAEADPAACDHILSFGLIWLEYLRAREKRRVVEGLKLFLPRERATFTANRLAYLDAAQASFEIYELATDGSTARVEETTYGNLATSLDPALAAPQPGGLVARWIEALVSRFGAERIARPDGVISLRLRGLEFARASGPVMTSGLDHDRPVTPDNFEQVEQLADRIAHLRSPDAPDRQDPLYRATPEKWLESAVRAAITRIDGSLLPDPVYSQVPAVAGFDRGIIDLLGVDRGGRLAVLELKASEDIHLPLQGLDYWMRVKWHLDRGEFQKRGYFPGIEVLSTPPRLLLVSPAFDFHPTTESILRYLSPRIAVERIGLGAEWRSELKVVFRARGADRP